MTYLGSLDTGLQAISVEQRQAGQGIGVDAVGLGVAGQNRRRSAALAELTRKTRCPRLLKNTAMGSHAGPVGSITTSRIVPAGVPARAAVSTAVRPSTLGRVLRLAMVVPSP
ncbi:MAG TPA: hypothetical protein VK988_18395 [Acidimicrobiales bacterium]|nr:hypothetical protein [Acidimicrobiales bacterium]